MNDNSKTLAHSLLAKERTKDVTIAENVTFSSLILPPEILKGLTASGFEKPSPIQVKALPVGRCGFDLIVKSKSGTGKTLVFGIISLESIKLDKRDPQVLILVPTREIAVQIQDVIKSVGKYFQGLSVESFIGGLPLAADKTKCKSCHIAVGTPGRVKQLIQDGFLLVDSIKIFVLDEADKLMEESFQNDINNIYNYLPNHKQIIMSSATYPDEMQTFLEQYMLSPVIVSVELETPLLLGLRHYVRLLKSSPNVVQQTKIKNNELLKILTKVPFIQCLIFSNYQTRAESISNFLNRNSWNSIFMSAAQNQTERLNSLSDLKDFKKKILVTTDLTARGIDAPNIDLVINYDIPINATTYLHRMGRAGRYGSTGNCINMTFIGQESKLLQNILGVIGSQNLSIPIVDESYNLNINQIPKENYLFGEIDAELKDFKTYKTKISEIRSSLAENNAKKEDKKKHKNKDDAFSILNQLASDNTSDLKTNNENPCLLLQQLASEGVIMDSIQTPTNSDETFSKNKALLGVAKMLSNEEASNEDFKEMSDYLKSQETSEVDLKKVKLQENIMENIFSLAYKTQVDKGAEKWQNLLSEEQKKMLCDDFQTEMEEYYEEEDEDEDYDFEIEKEIEVNYTKDANDYSFMDWVPVEPKPKPLMNNQDVELKNSVNTAYYAQSPSSDYSARFEQYFEHCSNNLWQNGLTYDSVNSFDQWFFNNWERQLRTVRNFVQNKIYLEEMSKNNY